MADYKIGHTEDKTGRHKDMCSQLFADRLASERLYDKIPRAVDAQHVKQLADEAQKAWVFSQSGNFALIAAAACEWSAEIAAKTSTTIMIRRQKMAIGYRFYIQAVHR